MVFGTSSTDHGHIHEGWSQEEAATPHVVGDLAAATRQTTFTAQAAATSDLLLGTSLTVDGPFDTDGPALDVRLVGDGVSTSAYDVDSMLLPVRDFPPVAAGFPEAALDLLQRMYGSGGVTLPWASQGHIHAYYPLRGHDQGFTVDGSNQPYFQENWGRSFNNASSANAAFYRGTSACLVNYWERQPSSVVALRCTPMQGAVVAGANVNYQAMRVIMTGLGTISTKISLQWAGGPDTSIFVRISRTAGTGGTLSISGQYRQYNASVATTVEETSISTGSLDMSKPIQLVIQWGWTSATVNGTLRVKAYAYDPTDQPAGAPTIVRQVDLANAMRGELVANSADIVRTAGGGGFRDMILSQAPAGLNYHYPQIVEPSMIIEDFTKDQIGVYPPGVQLAARAPVHAWSGSGWDYLKMLLAARGLAARVDGRKLRITDLPTGPTSTRLSGLVGAPTLNLRGSGRARSVDVIEHRSDVSRSWSAGPTRRESVSLTIRQNAPTVATVPLPTGMYQSGRVEFGIVDSDDATVTQQALFARGARFSVTIGRDSVMRLNIRGPRDGVGLGPGPWRIIRLDIWNVGYFENRQTMTLLTGAPDAMITREKGGTVTNPFLSTQGDVYDRGIWAAMAAGNRTWCSPSPCPHRVAAATCPGSSCSSGTRCTG